MKGTASMIETGQFGEFAGAVVSQLWNIVKDKKPEELQMYIEKTSALRDILKKAFGGNGKQLSSNISGIYSVSVDYGILYAYAVKLGKYDWANIDINSKNFITRRNGKAEITIELIHFNRFISSENVLRGINENGYRPAELHELLVLGEKYPDLQRKFSIAALDSVWRGPGDLLCVPCLVGGVYRRYLDLVWFENDWYGYWRFAVVRK